MNVRAFKLVSGDEFAAEVVENGANCVVVKNPITLRPTPQGLAPVPALLLFNNDQSLNLDREDIVFEGAPKKELENLYLEVFSGVAQASPEVSKILLGR